MMIKSVCEYCGKKFKYENKQGSRKYCETKCTIKALRDLTKEKEEQKKAYASLNIGGENTMTIKEIGSLYFAWRI